MGAPRFAISFIFLVNFIFSCNGLKLLSPEELTTFTKSKNLVLALFDDSSCKPCKQAAIELGKVASELSGFVDVEVVKSSSSYLSDHGFALKWMPSPVIFLFRENTPVLYDGAVDAQQIAEWIMHNMRHSPVKTLTDDTFEHLTQSASGATTGDWFILFTETHSSAHQAFSPIWESVGARLNGKLNIATVDVRQNPNVLKRFKISKFPAFIFFRFQKMYRYDIEKKDAATLIAFALGWYKNVKAETVPGISTPFDDLTDAIAESLKESSWLIWGGATIIAFVIGAIFIIQCAFKKSSFPTKTD